ncbi:MAG: hypothetical protein K6T75_11695 [Acetobacteraceae bacterium]|nr:hypothetical protein [Acetobacteraceae bacterium]
MTDDGTLGPRSAGIAAPGLTVWAILRVFLPLSLSDVIMILSGPILTIGLARLAAPETSLAAYSVAQNVAILIESPIIMLLHASTALTRYRGLYRPLWRFMVAANLALTALYLAVAFTPLFDLVFRGVLGQPPAVVAAARPAFQLMLLWPAAIGWRRFYQGVLINRRQAGRVALAGLARLGSLALVTFLGVVLRAPGAALAGLALAVSVIAEAVAVTLFAWKGRPRGGGIGRPEGSGGRGESREDLGEGAEEATEPPPAWAPRTVRAIARWYRPLAMTQVLVWSVRPLINGGIARTVSPEVGLAAWPVAWSTVIMVANSVRAVQQLTLSLLSGEPEYRLLRRFVWAAGLVASAVMALLAFTPLGLGYMRWVLGLRGGLEEIALAALPALKVAVGYPLLVALQNWLQGLLIRSGRPRLVNAAAVVGGLVTVAVVYAGALIWRLPGAVLGAVALVTGLLAELGVLFVTVRRAEGLPWSSAH